MDPGGDLLDRHARARSAGRTRGHGVARSGGGAGDGRVGRRAPAVRDRASVPDRAAGRGADHDGAGDAGRAPGPADERSVSGADHADAGGRDHGRARHDQLPQRRPRLHRLRRQYRPHPADPPAERRDQRSGVLPLLGHRGDPDVPVGARARPRAAGTGLGGDPPERVGRAGGRHQHDVLQALGVRAGVVRHRRRRRPGGRQLPLPELADVRDPGFDHAAGRGADGRCVQHVGRDHRRVPAEVPAGAAQQLGRVPRLADDPVRHRRAPGPDDRAARTRRPGAEGPRAPRATASWPVRPSASAGGRAE